MGAKLFFYYSAMNAGKSTTLLQSSYNYEERGMKTVLFAPSFDTRYGEGKITSRIGLEAEAVRFDDSFDFFIYLRRLIVEEKKDIRCALVDEAQFLTHHQVLQLSRVTVFLDIPVLTYGIRTDFKGEPFEGSKYLLAVADQLLELKTICHCGRKATMNLRIDEFGRTVKEGAQVDVGGNEKYTSVCRKHFLEEDPGCVSRVH